MNPKKYNGNEKVGGVVGNASTLRISHFGSTTVNIDSCKFSLNDILYCPTASTTLISIHRLTSDNHCYILIFPDRFVMKDLKKEDVRMDCIHFIVAVASPINPFQHL